MKLTRHGIIRTYKGHRILSDWPWCKGQRRYYLLPNGRSFATFRHAKSFIDGLGEIRTIDADTVICRGLAQVTPASYVIGIMGFKLDNLQQVAKLGESMRILEELRFGDHLSNENTPDSKETYVIGCRSLLSAWGTYKMLRKLFDDPQINQPVYIVVADENGDPVDFSDFEE